MKRVFPAIISLLILAVFSTCEKLDFNPATKVKTLDATPQANSILLEGEIIELSGNGNSDFGFCYGTSNDPTINDGFVSCGEPSIGNYSGVVENLDTNTRYYIRSYCLDDGKYIYSESILVTTKNGIPVVTTIGINERTINTITCGGIILDDGGLPITARGVCWSDTNNPTLNNSFTLNGQGLGEFSSTIEELVPNTTFYYRAYATNSLGTVYGSEINFIAGGLPELSTSQVSIITDNEATSGGNVFSDGGVPITEKGICWGKQPNPTISDNKTNEGSGSEEFVSVASNLQINSKYYIRAYAKNAIGVNYGNEILHDHIAVGMSYQGGKIAYIFQSGDPGYEAGQNHGIIAAEADQVVRHIWGCFDVVVGETLPDIGSGFANTEKIMSVCGSGSAAEECSELILNGYSDWCLPSINELQILYQNRNLIGGFSPINDYWSSTEESSSSAYVYQFYYGRVAYLNKSWNYTSWDITLRAIRYF